MKSEVRWVLHGLANLATVYATQVEPAKGLNRVANNFEQQQESDETSNCYDLLMSFANIMSYCHWTLLPTGSPNGVHLLAIPK